MNARLCLALVASFFLSLSLRAAIPAEVPCKVIQKTAPTYPLNMSQQGVVRGQAQLVVEIDPAGNLGDVLITAYTHRPFAEAALAALKEWDFVAGSIDGQPITSILTIDFEFETSGIVAHEVTFDSKSLDRIGHTYTYRPQGVDTLDRRPGRPRGEQPVYPKAWIDEGRAGSVVVTFFIDESGRARLPAVTEGTDRALISSALSAVKTWQFDPPTHAGKPVLVRATQRFDFDLPAAPAEAKRG